MSNGKVILIYDDNTWKYKTAQDIQSNKQNLGNNSTSQGNGTAQHLMVQQQLDLQKNKALLQNRLHVLEYVGLGQKKEVRAKEEFLVVDVVGSINIIHNLSCSHKEHPKSRFFFYVNIVRTSRYLESDLNYISIIYYLL